MGNSLNKFFKPGFLTTVMDGQFGSSGKGKLSAYIGEHADNWQFCCNAMSVQAGHTVLLDDGRKFFYQHLNSVAYNQNKFEKMYIGAGACVDLQTLLNEIESNDLPVSKLGISPWVAMISHHDSLYEKGQASFDQADLHEPPHEGTCKTGSTGKGVGSCLARKVLRRPSMVYAKDLIELKDYICDVPKEIMDRLDHGQSGLLEIAQGFGLSHNHRFVPYVTSRPVTVSQGLSDMMLPPRYSGPVIINFRTFPIRINSNKYIALDDNRHLTWEEVKSGVPHKVYEGNSGPWYEDQDELSWEDITQISGSDTLIQEYTSVTKLLRRVATFSAKNLVEVIRYNAPTNQLDDLHVSLNFMNYVDAKMLGANNWHQMTGQALNWITTNFRYYAQLIELIGTGPKMSDMIEVSRWDI